MLTVSRSESGKKTGIILMTNRTVVTHRPSRSGYKDLYRRGVWCEGCKGFVDLKHVKGSKGTRWQCEQGHVEIGCSVWIER